MTELGEAMTEIALIIISVIFPVAVIITYSIGLEHGVNLPRDEPYKHPAVVRRVINAINPPRGVSKHISKDKKAEFLGLQESYFDYDDTHDQFTKDREA